ncbi:hypothetical protein Br6_03324 [Rhodococcus sp. Br-6]|nr:hypothetical protein Br6_03324 [Rhodococcus sp. Br-6]
MPTSSSSERRIPRPTRRSGPTPSEIRWRARRLARASRSAYVRVAPANSSATASGVRATCSSNSDTSVAADPAGAAVAESPSTSAASANSVFSSPGSPPVSGASSNPGATVDSTTGTSASMPSTPPIAASRFSISCFSRAYVTVVSPTVNAIRSASTSTTPARSLGRSSIVNASTPGCWAAMYLSFPTSENSDRSMRGSRRIGSPASSERDHSCPPSMIADAATIISATADR